MRLRTAGLADVAALAETHALGFNTPWGADEIADLLTGPGGFGLLIEGETDVGRVWGFILGRALVGEAEVLTVTVAPARRRQGLGGVLLDAAVVVAAGLGARTMFLEVAADNDAAIRVYQRAGFEKVGVRPNYYRLGRETPMDAQVYRKDLV